MNQNQDKDKKEIMLHKCYKFKNSSNITFYVGKSIKLNKLVYQVTHKSFDLDVNHQQYKSKTQIPILLASK